MLPEKVIITIADTKDAALLTTLSITTFRDAFGPPNKKEDMDKYIADEMNQEKLTAELNDKNNVFFLATYKEVTAGYSKMRALYKPEELISKNPVEIERIYVQQDHHNKKIGEALMRHCIDYATGKQHDTIWLGVWEHNHKAIKFYERLGFELFGAHPFLLGYDLQTDVLMKKEL